MLLSGKLQWSLALIALAGLGLSGCQSTGGQSAQNIPVPPSVSEKDTCNVEQNLTLIGTDAKKVNLSKLPKGTRLLHPNSPVTMDFRPDRLNIYADDKGKIVRLDCN